MRHSLLPKLAACSCFESKAGEAGPAAQRGTMLDAAFRDALATGKLNDNNLSRDDAKAVKWAIKQVKAIAGDDEIISQEDMLKVQTPGIEHIGTEDVRVPKRITSCDLKTGIQRDYYAQMAAYAYGNMESYFCDEWTCYLIYCDQKEVVEHKFTLEKAKAIVKGILDAYADPNKQPSRCDYCSWCNKRDICSELVKPVIEVNALMDSTANLEALRQEIANDSERLGKFLQLEKLFQSELVKPLKEIAKAKLDAHIELPGWRLSKVKGSEYFDRVAIVSAAIGGKWGMDDLVDALGGTMSGETFRELCEKYRTPVQEDQAKRTDGFSKMIQDKKNK
jgi:hypothetical protein